MSALLVNRIGQCLDLQEAARVALKADALNKMCWRNSVLGLRRCYRTHPEAFYVEGHALSKHGLVVEHGWIEVDGAIIDPTPCWHTELEVVPCYFAGGRFRVSELRGLRAVGDFPCVHHPTYWRGPNAVQYKQSLLDCYCLCFNQPPETVRRFLRWDK